MSWCWSRDTTGTRTCCYIPTLPTVDAKPRAPRQDKHSVTALDMLFNTATDTLSQTRVIQGPEIRQNSVLHRGPSRLMVFISTNPAAKIFVSASLMPNEPWKHAGFVRRSWGTWKVGLFLLLLVCLFFFLPCFEFFFFWSSPWSSKAGSNLEQFTIWKGMHIHMCLCTHTSQKSQQISFREQNPIAGFWTRYSTVKMGHLLANPNDSFGQQIAFRQMFLQKEHSDHYTPLLPKSSLEMHKSSCPGVIRSTCLQTGALRAPAPPCYCPWWGKPSKGF